MQAMIKRVLPGLSLALLMLVSSVYTSSAMAASSREEAAAEAMGMHGQAGKVLSIREKNDQGNDWFEVKILTDGNVSVYRIEKN